MKVVLAVAAGFLLFGFVAVLAAPKFAPDTFHVQWGEMLMGGCAK